MGGFTSNYKTVTGTKFCVCISQKKQLVFSGSKSCLLYCVGSLTIPGSRERWRTCIHVASRYGLSTWSFRNTPPPDCSSHVLIVALSVWGLSGYEMPIMTSDPWHPYCNNIASLLQWWRPFGNNLVVQCIGSLAFLPAYDLTTCAVSVIYCS